MDDRRSRIPPPVRRIESAPLFAPILRVVLFLTLTVLVMLGIAFAVSFLDG
jgi:hypothetical protein